MAQAPARSRPATVSRPTLRQRRLVRALQVERPAWQSWPFWALWLRRAVQGTQRGALALTRSEWAFAALLTLCYGYFLTPAGTNTISRWDMVYALAHGGANIDVHASNTIDVSYYNGHWYSPRSLGLSLLATPVLMAIGHFVDLDNLHLLTLTDQIALLNAFTVLPASVAACLVMRRFAVRLRPELAQSPLPYVVAGVFGLATLFYPFTTTFFSHTVGGAFLFIGFYLLHTARDMSHSTQRILAAGLFSGLGVITEYPAGVIFLVLCGYILLAFPARRIKTLVYYGLGVLPSGLTLAWYNWYAFGNPFSLSYGFVSGNEFSGQHTGFFGITFPRAEGLWQILVYPRGLLIESPFLVLIPLGFYLWYRAGVARYEALAALAIAVIYPLMVSSYFLPMAGENLPGPRLLLPMLPFASLALVWVVDDARRWLRYALVAGVGFSLVITYLYVITGVRIYHNYGSYPLTDLFMPTLRTGIVPTRNGPTPPNLGALWLHIPLPWSIYLVAIALLAWYYAATRAILGAPAPTHAPDAPSTTETLDGETPDAQLAASH
ncbi:MAG TPA: hypothetical protein VF808_03030 [Ktedonobacterales bacterium]